MTTTIYKFVYKTTNTINDKIYIGVHSTNILNDGYLGSGKLIHRAFEKYGIENFTREIIEFFGNVEDAYEKESEIVTKDFLNRIDVYNLTVGGYGGFHHINNPDMKQHYVQLTKDKISKKSPEELMNINDKKRRFGSENGMYGVSRSGKNAPMYGKNHTQEAKYRMGLCNIGRTWSNETREKIMKSRKETLDNMDIHFNAKNWMFIDPNGGEVSFNNLEKYCRENNLNPICMSRVYNGINKQHKGYTIY